MRTCHTVVAASLLFAIGCSSGSRDTVSEGTWVGGVTTEGNVTTVVNESGSIWGGMATLVVGPPTSPVTSPRDASGSSAV
jgi:hypothetical protein